MSFHFPNLPYFFMPFLRLFSFLVILVQLIEEKPSKTVTHVLVAIFHKGPKKEDKKDLPCLNLGAMKPETLPFFCLVKQCCSLTSSLGSGVSSSVESGCPEEVTSDSGPRVTCSSSLPGENITH